MVEGGLDQFKAFPSLAAQNMTGEIEDGDTTAIITWTVVFVLVILNAVVVGFQIYGQRSKFFFFNFPSLYSPKDW